MKKNKQVTAEIIRRQRPEKGENLEDDQVSLDLGLAFQWSEILKLVLSRMEMMRIKCLSSSPRSPHAKGDLQREDASLSGNAGDIDFPSDELSAFSHPDQTEGSRSLCFLLRNSSPVIPNL